jgi:hypothetical protein
MRDLVLQTLPQSIGHVLLGSFLGLAAGLAVAAVLAFLFHRLGAFRIEGRHARGLRVASTLWILAAGLCGGGLIGGGEGTLRGAERTVADAAFRGGPLLSSASCVSGGVAWLDLRLQGIADPSAELHDYMAGRRTLDVPAFYDRLGKAEAKVVDGLVATWNTQAQARLGLQASPLVDTLLAASLRLVAQRLVRKAVEDTAKDYGVVSAKDGFFSALESGPGRHAELSLRLVDRCLAPLALAPVRFFVRAQQTTVALVGLAAVFLPVLGFWIARIVVRRNACTKPGASDILPGNGGPPA